MRLKVFARFPLALSVALLALLCTTSLSAQTITQQPANVTVQVGQTATFNASVSNGPCRSLWSINGQGHYGPIANTVSYSFPAATLAQSGTTVQVEFYGCASGTVSVRSAIVKLTVVPAIVLETIAVTPIAPTIGIGQTQVFTAVGTYSDGSTQDLTSTVTWTSQSPTNASLAGNTATGLMMGSSIIQAASGSVVGSTLLVIEPLINISLSALYTDGSAVPLQLVISKDSTDPTDGTTIVTGLEQFGAPGGSFLVDPGFTYQIDLLLNGTPVVLTTYYPASLLLAIMPKLSNVTFSIVLIKGSAVPQVQSFQTGAS